MLRIENIKLLPDEGMAVLCTRAAKLLGVREAEILSLQVLRRSVDAREGVCLVYTVGVHLKNETAVRRAAAAKKSP